MQWSGKVPAHGLSPAMRKRHEQVLRGERLNTAMAEDPAFQVRTMDGRHWICPYTHTLVAIHDGTLAAARTFLFDRHPWTSGRGKPRPLVQVLEQKWTLHLTTTTDARFLRFSADGRWQNPYTATWSVPLPTERPRAIPRIALLLATCPQAQAGEPLTAEQLDAARPPA